MKIVDKKTGKSCNAKLIAKSLWDMGGDDEYILKFYQMPDGSIRVFDKSTPEAIDIVYRSLKQAESDLSLQYLTKVKDL